MAFFKQRNRYHLLTRLVIRPCVADAAATLVSHPRTPASSATERLLRFNATAGPRIRLVATSLPHSGDGDDIECSTESTRHHRPWGQVEASLRLMGPSRLHSSPTIVSRLFSLSDHSTTLIYDNIGVVGLLGLQSFLKLAEMGTAASANPQP